jgi:hypothetical protein
LSWVRIYKAILGDKWGELEILTKKHNLRCGYHQCPIESTEIIIAKTRTLTKPEIKDLIKGLTVSLDRKGAVL